MRGKGFLDTAPTVALNDVQMAHLWITKEPPKEYSDFGEVSLQFALLRAHIFARLQDSSALKLRVLGSFGI